MISNRVVAALISDLRAVINSMVLGQSIRRCHPERRRSTMLRRG